MMSLFKEPLLMFLLLGGGLFALSGYLSQPPIAENEIVVSQRQIAVLTSAYKKVWQRPPSETELEGLIRNYIREEIYYREALALGLDTNDGIVRKRLSQKMQFISENLTRLNNPTDEELEAYLSAHHEDYKQPSRITFRQIFLNGEQRGASADKDANELLVKLRSMENQSITEDLDLGDPLMIKQYFPDVTETEIERTLGSDFLQSIKQLPMARWQGPILSGYGYHLIYIDQRTESEVSKLIEVRDLVINDWSQAKRRESNEAFYKTLLEQYQVTIESKAI